MQRAEEEFGGLDEEKGGEDNEEATENGTATTTQGSGLPWDGSDRDYTYEELLGESQHCIVSGFPFARRSAKLILYTFLALQGSCSAGAAIQDLMLF
jgi:hypothetical protein